MKPISNNARDNVMAAEVKMVAICKSEIFLMCVKFKGLKIRQLSSFQTLKRAICPEYNSSASVLPNMEIDFNVSLNGVTSVFGSLVDDLNIFRGHRKRVRSKYGVQIAVEIC